MGLLDFTVTTASDVFWLVVNAIAAVVLDVLVRAHVGKEEE